MELLRLHFILALTIDKVFSNSPENIFFVDKFYSNMLIFLDFLWCAKFQKTCELFRNYFLSMIYPPPSSCITPSEVTSHASSAETVMMDRLAKKLSSGWTGNLNVGSDSGYRIYYHILPKFPFMKCQVWKSQGTCRLNGYFLLESIAICI